LAVRFFTSPGIMDKRITVTGIVRRDQHYANRMGRGEIKEVDNAQISVLDTRMSPVDIWLLCGFSTLLPEKCAES
jgi:hypothetical protein